MAGRTGRYPPEYKEEFVGLVRAGRSPGSLAREFEPSEQTVRNWVKQADVDEGRRSDGLTTKERIEIEPGHRIDSRHGSKPVADRRQHSGTRERVVSRRGAGHLATHMLIYSSTPMPPRLIELLRPRCPGRVPVEHGTPPRWLSAIAQAQDQTPEAQFSRAEVGRASPSVPGSGPSSAGHRRKPAPLEPAMRPAQIPE